MQERERMREADVDAEFFVDTIEELEQRAKTSRRGFLERVRNNVVMKGKQIPWRLFTQGIIRRYNPEWGDNRAANDNVTPFQHLIPQVSGRHRHQGGFSLFVLEGKGYTVVDGVRHNWEKGDFIMLPLKPEGCEHQHFNTGDKPARWMACPTTFSNHAIGQTGGQRESSPLWEKYRGKYLGPYADDKKEQEDKKLGKKTW